MTPRFNDDSPATTAVATRHLATKVTLAFHLQKLQAISLQAVSLDAMLPISLGKIPYQGQQLARFATSALHRGQSMLATAWSDLLDH